jgi:hypothetical protein
LNIDCCDGGGTGGAVVEVAECGVGSQKLERSEVVMKASMTEELSSQMLFILFVVVVVVGGVVLFHGVRIEMRVKWCLVAAEGVGVC